VISEQGPCTSFISGQWPQLCDWHQESDHESDWSNPFVFENGMRWMKADQQPGLSPLTHFSHPAKTVVYVDWFGHRAGVSRSGPSSHLWTPLLLPLILRARSMHFYSLFSFYAQVLPYPIGLRPPWRLSDEGMHIPRRENRGIRTALRPKIQDSRPKGTDSARMPGPDTWCINIDIEDVHLLFILMVATSIFVNKLNVMMLRLRDGLLATSTL
jgi:hypothetical protein